MKDIHADHMPRSRTEKAVGPRAPIDAVLDDWSDDNWLQFSMWHTYQIRAYLYRVLADKGCELRP